MTDYDVAQLARLEPAYQERLGLNTAPFPPTHEDRFLFLDAERRQRLQMLQHLTQYSNLLLMLVGERGIGKTSLLDRFAAEAKPEWQLCRIQANALMDADQLLYDIATGFGLAAPPHDPASLQETLFQHLLKLREQDRTPILIIDDAHELPRDALQAVFHLADAETAEGNLLRVILACEPQIERMLEDPAIAPLRERITHTLDIPPFDRAGTADYLAHRLAVAGLSGASPFTDKALDQIFRASEGVPARINEAAHLWLSDGGASELPGPWPADDAAETDGNEGFLQRLPKGQLAAAGAIALLLALALLFQDRINALFEPAPPESAGTTEPPPASAAPEPADSQPAPEAGPAQPAEPAPPPPAPAIERIDPATLEGGGESVTLTLHGRGFTADSRVEMTGQGERHLLPTTAVQWLDTRSARVTLQPPPAAGTWQLRVLGPSGAASDPATFTVTAVPAPKPAPAKSEPPAAPPQPPTRPAPQPQHRPAPESAPAAKPAPKTETAPTPSATGRGSVPSGLWDRRWLLQQPKDHVTLQLLSTRQKANVERFVKRHGLDGMAVAFETRRNGQTWYSVVVGSYPDRTQAQKAFRQLPQSVQKLQPWIRRFDGIQQALKPVPATAPKPLPIHLPPPDNLNPADHLSWLWNRDPSHFALQLMAGHDEGGVQRFLRQHRLLGKAVYYRTRRNGQPWFVVVYGDFADRNAARQAIDKLPPAIQHLRPWPRSFGSIHDELDRN